jgi:hypothetical protein
MACEYCEPVEASLGFVECKPIKTDKESMAYLRKICFPECEWWEMVATYRIPSRDITTVVTCMANCCPMCGRNLKERRVSE